ncbi:hypothetical protein HZS_1190 [Henneguya salminicola]|nr:hypothetical protein HZS_1190 [Henneguya salminicola]
MRSLQSIEDDQINEKLQAIQNLKGLTHQNWPQILEYFSRIWLEKYTPSLWKNERQTKNINSRTNNCLERYNRRFGKNNYVTRTKCPLGVLMNFMLGIVFLNKRL